MPRRPIRPGQPYAPKAGKLAGRTFTTEHQYRVALARANGFPSLTAAKRSARPIRTLTASQSLTAIERDVRLRALDAISRMRRDGLSLTRAAHEAKTTPNAVLKFGGSALQRGSTGAYAVTKSDRLYREMRMLTPRGIEVIGVTDSRTASDIATYMNAVNRYGKTGNTDALRPFRGKSVRAMKKGHPYITDPRTLDRLLNVGEISFEDLYARGD